MKKILMTGSTGFIGSNVLDVLSKCNEYEILTPHRNDLNLKDEKEVVSFLKNNNFDVIVHFANPTPSKNKLDSFETLTEDSLRMFLNFYNHSDLYSKMIYTGSGAEYDKSIDIDYVSEKDCFRSIPSDTYGFSKLLLNLLAEKSENIYNFRIFGCYGPGDAATKFITHCIRSVILKKNITIRKDCLFDYLHVYDFARYIKWGIDNTPFYHNYNVSSGTPILLSDIAKIVINKMNTNIGLELLSEERNFTYTGSNERIISESGINPEYTIEKGIEKQIEWEIANWSDSTVFDGK